MNILLADDDCNIHVVITLWLERNGHQITSVYNGENALEHLKTGSYDALITDVNMPLLKGYDLIRETMRLEQRPPLIIMLTSRCDVGELKNDFDHPEVQVLSKPFSPAGLANLVNQWDQEKNYEFKSPGTL